MPTSRPSFDLWMVCLWLIFSYNIHSTLVGLFYSRTCTSSKHYAWSHLILLCPHVSSLSLGSNLFRVFITQISFRSDFDCRLSSVLCFLSQMKGMNLTCMFKVIHFSCRNPYIPPFNKPSANVDKQNSLTCDVGIKFFDHKSHDKSWSVTHAVIKSDSLDYLSLLIILILRWCC